MCGFESHLGHKNEIRWHELWFVPANFFTSRQRRTLAFPTCRCGRCVGMKSDFFTPRRPRMLAATGLTPTPAHRTPREIRWTGAAHSPCRTVREGRRLGGRRVVTGSWLRRRVPHPMGPRFRGQASACRRPAGRRRQGRRPCARAASWWNRPVPEGNRPRCRRCR